ncbi:UNKNOWN [Stylonychia lemnae]|uniref:Uncharacterized protein n=1 Tax=Stylonychia lemnae TaxID=5949 RepID=A0A078A7B2_STYLE|nr:UNKNOWN [Stylonychia lemnae]|eukprot:CDW77422.1 UNKNOWN [Stylonychia lemnae]
MIHLLGSNIKAINKRESSLDPSNTSQLSRKLLIKGKISQHNIKVESYNQESNMNQQRLNERLEKNFNRQLMETHQNRKDHQKIKTLEIDGSNAKEIELDRYLSSLYATGPIFVGMPQMRFNENRLSWKKLMNDMINFYAPEIPYNYFQQKRMQKHNEIDVEKFSTSNTFRKKKQMMQKALKSQDYSISSQITPIDKVKHPIGKSNLDKKLLNLKKQANLINDTHSDPGFSSKTGNRRQFMFDERDLMMRRQSCQCLRFCGARAIHHKGDFIAFKRPSTPIKQGQLFGNQDGGGLNPRQNSNNRLKLTSPNREPLLDSPLRSKLKQEYLRVERKTVHLKVNPLEKQPEIMKKKTNRFSNLDENSNDDSSHSRVSSLASSQRELLEQKSFRTTNYQSLSTPLSTYARIHNLKGLLIKNEDPNNNKHLRPSLQEQMKSNVLKAYVNIRTPKKSKNKKSIEIINADLLPYAKPQTAFTIRTVTPDAAKNILMSRKIRSSQTQFRQSYEQLFGELNTKTLSLQSFVQQYKPLKG